MNKLYAPSVQTKDTSAGLASIRVALILTCILAISGCKVRIEVPEGGRVMSESGAYYCNAGQPCVIDVVDYFFDESFIAEPEPGYLFRSWDKGDRFLCGANTSKRCGLSTSSHGWLDDDAIFGPFLESDEVFYLRPRFEKGSCTYIKEENILDIQWGEGHSYFWNEEQSCSLPGVLNPVKHGRFVEYNTHYGATLQEARLVVCQSDYDLGTLVRHERWVSGLMDTYPGSFLSKHLIVRPDGSGVWKDYGKDGQESRREFVTRVDVCEEA